MKSSGRIKVLVVFGTRPEAIKLAPVIKSLRHESSVSCKVCFTGQHKSMVSQVVDFFDLKLDYNLNVMRKGQSLEYLTQSITPRVGRLLDELKPDWVVVQGDTTTVLLVAMAAFYKKIKVAHVEAGLRTHDKYYPFPEEINRALLSPIADANFAPTLTAKENLIKEGIASDKIFVTGNTGIDALHWALGHMREEYVAFKGIDFNNKIILATIHRRESFGRPFQEIFKAFVDIIEADDKVEIVYPVHLNPNVQEKAKKILSARRRIHLIDPLPYDQLIYLMAKSYIILTDSGGIQEEAPSLKRPVLVVRDETERPEGVKLGVARLVGRKRKDIAAAAIRLLRSKIEYAAMVKARNPYGDGLASARIVKALMKISRKGRYV